MFRGYTLARTLDSSPAGVAGRRRIRSCLLGDASDLQQGKQDFAFEYMFSVLLGFYYSMRVLVMVMWLTSDGYKASKT